MKIQDEKFKEKELIQEINSGVQGWNELNFEQIGQWIGGYAFKSSDFENTNIENECMQVLKMGNVKMGLIDSCNNPAFIHKDKLTDRHKDFVLKSGDILISLTGTINKTDYGNVAPVEIDDIFILNQRVARFRTQSRLQRNFFYYYMQGKQFRSKFFLLGLGGTGNQANVGISDLKAMTAPVPPTCEQEKIAEILSTWDKAIELKEKLIEEKKKQKSGLIQKLLTGKVRLPGFDGELNYINIDSHIKEIKLKNKSNKETRVLSVTNKLGFILQEEQFDRVVASKDLSNYKIVKKGQFAYNPSRVNVGSIDQLKNFDSGLLSPMYVVFECTEGLVSRYLYHFIKSDMFLNIIPNMLQGSVRDSLSFDSLKLIKLFVPSVCEQEAIAEILNKADIEIKLHEKELKALKQQMKGLMQLLLTGIVRVNVETN